MWYTVRAAYRIIIRVGIREHIRHCLVEHALSVILEHLHAIPGHESLNTAGTESNNALIVWITPTASFEEIAPFVIS